jgi:hypothetical protein
MRYALDPNSPTDPPGWREEVIASALVADRQARRHPEFGESLTMVASKPG